VVCANLREAEYTPIQYRAVAVLRIGEGIVTLASLEAVVADSPRCLAILEALKEGLIRPLHPAQHILQDLGMHLGIFRTRRLELRQFYRLLVVAGVDTLAASLPRLALLKGNIVERAAAPHHRLQRLLLIWCWVQLVLEGLANGISLLVHTVPYCLTDGKAAIGQDIRRLTATRLSSPCLQYRGLQPVLPIKIPGSRS